MPVVFPHANKFEIEDDDFRRAWLALLDGQRGAGPAIPRLPSIKPLQVLIETTTAPGNTHPLSLEYLLRTLVPPASQTTMQATNQFLDANTHIIERTPAKVENPAGSRRVEGVQLIPLLDSSLDQANVRQIAEPRETRAPNAVNNGMDQSAQVIPPCNPALIPRNAMGMLRRPTRYTYLGDNPWNWANHIEDGLGNRLKIPAGPMTRADVRTFCRNLKNSDEACFIVVAAWGRMKTNNGRATWAARRNWLPVLHNIRRKIYSRKDAYQEFANLRAHNQLPGMGPAYFTKIIFFANVKQVGYIMDQWTGKSMNLLCRSIGLRNCIPHMTPQGLVSDNNIPADYESFNRCIEALATRLGITAEECEQRLFSNGANGGQPLGIWRQYVQQNWRPE
jgi:hypothetical protein